MILNAWLQCQKNDCIEELEKIVNKSNNAYHAAIKMKHVEVKSSPYFDFNKKNKKKVSNFEVGEHLGVSRHTNIFGKDIISN